MASSDTFASQVDEMQYAAGHGPCLESLRTNRVVHVPDLSIEKRWGRYPQHALAGGVRSSISFPLVVEGGGAVGALNMYTRTTDFFSGSASAAAEAFTGQAALTLSVALRLATEAELGEQLRTALSSRSVIDQAMGIIMAKHHCRPDEAFALLRAASQSRNIKLRTVAAELVEATGRSEPWGTSVSDDDTGRPRDAALQQAVETAWFTTRGADAAGISLDRDGKVVTVAWSDDMVLSVDAQQYATDEGPCLQALRRGEPVELLAMARETRWPNFTSRAHATGIESMASTPVRVRGRSVASLNLYSRTRAPSAVRSTGRALP